MTRTLLLLHGVLGFTAVFAATHHAAHAVLSALDRPQQKALRRFGWIAPAAVIAQTIAGLLIYPAYRVQVRAADLERSAPFVVRLFDFKEHLSALALALVVSAAVAGRSEKARWPIAALSCTGTVFLWTAAIIGLYVTARHAV